MTGILRRCRAPGSTAIASALVVLGCALLTLGAPAVSPAEESRVTAETRAVIKTTIDVAARYLYAQQREEGSWNGSPIATSLVSRALMESPRRYREVDGPFIRKALGDLVALAEPSGRIAEGEPVLVSTAVAAAALAASENPIYEPLIANATNFVLDALLPNQVRSKEGATLRLAEVGLILEALTAAGLAPDHPVWQSARDRLRGCDLVGPGSNPNPAAAAGCSEIKDRRDLLAALQILSTVDSGSGDADSLGLLRWVSADLVREGLRSSPSDTPSKESFLLAAALESPGQPTLVDERGEPFDWRRILVARLTRQQQSDGFWRGDDEDRPGRERTIATALAMLALESVGE